MRKPAKPTAMPTDECAMLFATWSKMIADAKTPIERVDRVREMYEAAIARRSRMAFDAAMAAMAPTLPVIGKEAKATAGDRTYAFAKWEDIAEPIVKILAEHGFVLTFRVEDVPRSDEIKVTAVLAHSGGHREETGTPFPFDKTGAKNPLQARGSAISYGKRYVAGVILNIITRGEDDDGQASNGTQQTVAAAPVRLSQATITDQQTDELRTLLTGRSTEQFMRIAQRECRTKLDSLSDIPAAKFDAVKALLTVGAPA